MRHQALLVVLVVGLLGCSGKEPAAYELAYPSEWRFSVAGPVGGYLAIVNTSDAPLSLETLKVKSITDDHPTASVKITTSPFATSVGPNEAGGFLTPLAKKVLVDSGLVSETRVDTNSDYLTIEIADAPEGTYDIKATLEISLDGLTTKLPMTIHVVPGPTIFANPDVGKRIKVFR
jgi:hypothetical protein